MKESDLGFESKSLGQQTMSMWPGHHLKDTFPQTGGHCSPALPQSPTRFFFFFEGPQEPHLATVKRLKLKSFGHVSRHDNLSKPILQGILAVGRGRGGQRKC